jgi:hypothetical protein
MFQRKAQLPSPASARVLISTRPPRPSEASPSAEEPSGLRNGAGNPPTDQGVRQHPE